VFINPLVDLHSAFYLKAEEVGDVKASKAVEVILLINELFVCLLHFEHRPVEHVVVLKGLAVKQFLEQSLEVGVVGLVIKAEGTAVFKVTAEFGGITFAKLFRAGGHFPVPDAFVLLLLGVGYESLPGEAAANKVHENIAQAFQIVASALFNANV